MVSPNCVTQLECVRGLLLWFGILAIIFFIFIYLSYPWCSSSFEVDLPLSEALSSVMVSLTLGASRLMFTGVNLELSSLVLQNKSHPPFLVGDFTGPFLQVKYTSCMARTISQDICIMKNSYAPCNCLANTTFIHISQKISRSIPYLP